MSGGMASIAKRALVVLLVALAAVVLLQPAGQSTRRLDIVSSAERAGTIQVFYDTGNGFNEKQSGRARVERTRGVASIGLPNTGVRRLRIDPDPKQSWLRLYEIRIAGVIPGRGERLLLSDLLPKKDIARLDSGRRYVEVQMTGGKDPQLVLNLDEPVGAVHGVVPAWLTRNAGRLFWLLALVLVAIGWRHQVRPASAPAIPWMLAIAGVLVLGMAFITSTVKSVHPDEFMHVQSAMYYFSHWIPRAVADPEMAPTYNPAWGVSYLNNWDVVYFFAAKCVGLWNPITSDTVVALRLFNVMLLLGLAFFASLRREFAQACSVLLLTPQAWYVFAYFNGDALPLCLSMLAVALIATKDSPVSRFIRSGGKPTWHVVLFVAAVGLLLVSKRNYLVVVLFIGMLLAWRHLAPAPLAMFAGFVGAAMAIVKASSLGALSLLWPAVDRALGFGSLVLLGVLGGTLVANLVRRVELRPAFKRMAVVFLLAGIVAVPRVAVDLWINGSPGEKAVQIAAAAETHAQPRFKPSTVRNDIESAHAGLRFAKRGVSLQEMLWTRHAWIASSWRSSLGVYGYMNVFAPQATYWVLTIGILIFGTGVLAHALGRGQVAGATWIGLGSLVLVVLSSISFSWFYGYQPQGRYLFAGIPIFGAVVAAAVEDGLESPWLRGALVACFVVSVLSFVGAMGKIP